MPSGRRLPIALKMHGRSDFWEHFVVAMAAAALLHIAVNRKVTKLYGLRMRKATVLNLRLRLGPILRRPGDGVTDVRKLLGWLEQVCRTVVMVGNLGL